MSVLPALSGLDVSAPPPHGHGTGMLYLVAKDMVVGQQNLGPAVLFVKEYRHNNTWGPPGGQTDKTDHSPLHTALREFNEEVSRDWRNIANACLDFRLVCVHQSKDKANESWCMLVDAPVTQVENALFGEDRSKFTLSKRANTILRNGETGGYAWVPLAVLADIAKKDKDKFRLGPYTFELRDKRRTNRAVLNIVQLL